MVIVTVNFCPSKEHEKTFLASFNTLARESRKEDGCMAYEIYSKGEVSREYFLFEKWESKAKLEAHWRTEHFATFMKLSKDWFEKDNELGFFEATEIQLG